MRGGLIITGVWQLSCFRGVLLGAVSLGYSAQAFDVVPEAITPSLVDFRRAPDPERLTPEYSSDVLTYSLPISWECSWRRLGEPSGARGLFQHSAGSLSTFHLANYGRTQMDLPLSDSTTLRLTTLDQRDFESENTAVLPELRLGLFEGFFASFLASPSLSKEAIDLGATADVVLLPWGLGVRVGGFAVDYPRNKHAEDGSRFAGGNPYTAFLGLHRERGASCWGVVARRETPARLLTSEEGGVFAFHRSTVLGYGFWSEPFSWAKDIGVRFQCSVLSQSTSEAETTFSKCESQAEISIRLEPFEQRLGLYAVQRHYEKGTASFRSEETTPYVDFIWPRILSSEHSVVLGAESSFSLVKNRAWEFADPQRYTTADNHRLNLRWIKEFVSSEGSEVSFLASFDLDEKGTRNRFEGGAVRVQAGF